MFMVRCSLFIIVLFLFQSCAEIIPLTGGEVDRTAPKVLAQYPEQEGLFYQVNELIVQFDEFV